MMDEHRIKVSDFIEDESSERFEVKEVGEKVDPWYGLDTFTVSQEQIDALNAGKVLYASVNCEYAVLIKKSGAKMDEEVGG